MLASSMNAVRRIGITLSALLVVSLAAAGTLAQTGLSEPKSFASPQEAVEALVSAARAKDASAFVAIFGPALKEWIVSGDKVQDEATLVEFLEAYDRKHVIAKEGEGKATLSIGSDDYPFPFPLVRSGDRWAFDVEAGKTEMLNRRIGENELNTIEVLGAIVDAQRDYAALALKYTGRTQYARRFLSTPGKKDGLYWPEKEGEPESPLGPLIAEAQREGYRATGADNRPASYHGYHFRMLTAQGPAARGGAYDYMVAGRMIGGFAVLAYPARYGISGFKTFMVNHDGDVYEADLGPDTAARAAAIRTFNPDGEWTKQ